MTPSQQQREYTLGWRDIGVERGGVRWGGGRVLDAASLPGPGNKVLRSRALAANFVIQGN